MNKTSKNQSSKIIDFKTYPEPPFLGKYAELRRQYLKNHKRKLYIELLRTGALEGHLLDVEETATRRIELFIERMLERDPAPDKASDQMGWVRHMNMLKAQAEEFVYEDLIYS